MAEDLSSYTASMVVAEATVGGVKVETEFIPAADWGTLLELASTGADPNDVNRPGSFVTIATDESGTEVSIDRARTLTEARARHAEVVSCHVGGGPALVPDRL